MSTRPIAAILGAWQYWRQRAGRALADILMCLICAAQERDDKRVVLSAQRQAEGFYERFGFKTVGEEYMEAGINHIDMEFHFK